MRSDTNRTVVNGQRRPRRKHDSSANLNKPGAVKRNNARESINENDLVAFLRQNRREGIEMLYDRYAGSLFGVLFRLLHSHELAEDALQETFVKVWAGLDIYDASRGRLFTWMMNIARNVALDKIKSKDFRNSLKNQEIGSLVSLLEGKMAIAEASDQIGLREIVQALKPEYEEVIELIYFQGYTQAEASEKLGIPLGTVKTRARAAISTIRKFFS
jgi:RNA polymerase sigma factor (sigma-70 family)